ncbi:sensor domain-containing diguanylate cyclase [Butyrivibrio sp. YAB3001]|uniref:sensor domain-containing diguanylate cyclase n=1 Tax=Butyrivibrio sp. YAB3001 TaxID=1520812 RepID=UPI0008F652DB|nr:sensor domain-containing diguanylate cyclase [Butyrivibrio sp. YAB3001]SFC86284.1 diguanylate cyclase (GGDEF) domain-containing protein [Butyrivibrio sp. YAB3001]
MVNKKDEALINAPIIEQNSPEKEKYELFKALYSLYDYVNLLNITDLSIKRLYTSGSGFEIGESHFMDYIKVFAKKHIHPNDIDNYLEYADPINIQERFNDSDKNFSMAYFRARVDGGTYVWKAFIVLKPSFADEGTFLVCIRDVDYETEHILIKNDYVRLFNDLPLAYAVFQLEGESAEELKEINLIYASNRLSKLLKLDFSKILGLNFLSMLREEEKPVIKMFYDAAYNGKRDRRIFYLRHFEKWFCLITDQAASPGRCAVLFEDVTKEHMNTEKLGMEWRTDNIIINCTKLLHSGLPLEIAINEIIKSVGEAVGAERIYIIECTKENCFSETYEWVNNGTESAIDRFQNMAKEDLLNWEAEYPGAFSLVLNDVESIKDGHPKLYDKCKYLNIKSLIEIPIYDEEKLIGYFGALNSFDGIDVDVKELMETISYFLSSEFGRKRLMEELERKSVYDALCGVKNRSAMEMTAKRLKKRHYSVGVLYADANGLKQVNDTQGHEAGDELLKRICSVMKRRFNRENIYRAGGDEFVIIVSKVAKDSFMELCESLKKDFEEAENISVAIGWDWGAVSGNLDKIMKCADTLMYEDKANYYRKNNRRRSSDRC